MQNCGFRAGTSALVGAVAIPPVSKQQLIGVHAHMHTHTHTDTHKERKRERKREKSVSNIEVRFLSQTHCVLNHCTPFPTHRHTHNMYIM